MNPNEFAADLAEYIFRIIGVKTTVQFARPDEFGDFKIRSTDSDFASPHGWQITVEPLAELATCKFGFDSEAKQLNDFYLKRLNENATEFDQTTSSLQEDGLKMAWEVNGAPVPQLHFRNANPADFLFVGNFSIGADTQSERLHNLKAKVSRFAGAALLPLLPENPPDEGSQLSDETGLTEGALSRIEVNKYERSPKNRASCLAYYGSACLACGFKFESKYGQIADGFIHVHHMTPISEIGPDYRINPIRDLVPLCPNCHSVIHLRKPPLTIQELRDLMEG